MDPNSTAAQQQQQRLAEIAAEQAGIAAAQAAAASRSAHLQAEADRIRAAIGPPPPLNTRCDAMSVTIARALSLRFPGCCAQSASCDPAPWPF